MEEQQPTITVNDLPMTFQVKYLGHRPAKGLWGIKHTRKPVNELVETAKNLPRDRILPFVKIIVDKEGLSFRQIGEKKNHDAVTNFKVDTISYGVQDLIYTRVFCMIIVNDEEMKEGTPFVCHAFACDSKNQARQLTYALAATFQYYGQKVKEENKNGDNSVKKRFAIDLRTPQQINDEEDEDETEA